MYGFFQVILMGTALLLWSAASYAGPGPAPIIAQDVGVCDPSNPSHCMTPLANGSINVNATVTPAPPTPATYTPTGQCRLTVTTPAVQTSTCSGGIPANTNFIAICNEGSAARW